VFDIRNYDYDLPLDLIAQMPAEKRDHSRLLVVDRRAGALEDKRFFELPDLLRSGDLLVANNTRVVPARIYGHKETGGKVEVVVLEHPEADVRSGDTRKCLMKSSGRPKEGSRLFFENDTSGVIEGYLESGMVSIRYEGQRGIDELLDARGRVPLPPYIKRDPDTPLDALDRERYQTVYSEHPGAVAAPTAGLHFTEPLMDKLKRSGVPMVPLTLHVGYDTFRPVKVADIRDHRLHGEYYRIESHTADRINQTRAQGGRVFAVGTTVVRALESAPRPGGRISACEGETSLMITPGHTFAVVDGLITNFHLPKSSLLFLVSAFMGLDLTKKAYRHAVSKRYRFYSYGDAMLIH